MNNLEKSEFLLDVLNEAASEMKIPTVATQKREYYKAGARDLLIILRNKAFKLNEIGE